MYIYWIVKQGNRALGSRIRVTNCVWKWVGGLREWKEEEYRIGGIKVTHSVNYVMKGNKLVA